MIFLIFIILILLVLVFLVIGYIWDLPVLKLVGWTFLFVLGVNTLNEGISVNIGTNSTQEFPCNTTIQDLCLSAGYYNVTTYTRDAYYNYESHFLSYWLCVVAAVMFADTLFSLKHEKKVMSEHE